MSVMVYQWAYYAGRATPVLRKAVSASRMGSKFVTSTTESFFHIEKSLAVSHLDTVVETAGALVYSSLSPDESFAFSRLRDHALAGIEAERERLDKLALDVNRVFGV